MRINEFTKISKDPKNWTKSKLLYEALPVAAIVQQQPMIFNADNQNSPSLRSHARRNTLAYRKMLNWD